MAQPTVQTNLTLPLEVRQKLDEYCRVTGRSMVSVVIAAVEMYIDGN